MTVTGLEAILLVVCLLGSALFSGTELSLIASVRHRLRSLGESRQISVDLTLDLLHRRAKILVTILIWGTLVNTAAAALGTSLLQGVIGATATTTIVTTIVLTIVILVFGEIVPKSVGRAHPEAILVGASRPLFALDLLFFPITAMANGLVHLVLKLLGGKREDVLTREDLKMLTQEVRGDTGKLHHEQRMLESIFDFGRTTAREVMVPMPSVVSIEKEASLDMLRAMLRRREYTRIPVFDRRVDRVVGVVHVFDALLDPLSGKTMEESMRPITLVPETNRIDRLMVEMQRRGESMVVVINEFGSCIGIVTVEDIIEEIMGELADEHEVGVKMIRTLGKRTYIVDALTDIDDLNDELALDLPKIGYDTVGGLVLRKLGRIPQEGERVELSGVTLEVVEVYPFGVRTLKLMLAPTTEESP